MRPPVGADQNTGTLYLSVNTSPKECGKERGSIQRVTHRECRDGVYDVNNTHGENLYLTLLPQLSLHHPPANPQSLVCLVNTPRKPVAVGIRIKINILYIKYSSLTLGSYKQF